MEPRFTPEQLHAALGRLREMVQRDPSHALAWHEIGLALHLLGRNSEAIAPMRRAVELAPTNDEFCYNLGLVLRREGNEDEAVGWYRRALAINPRHFHALNNLGNLARQAGRASEAIELFDRSLAIDPVYAFAHNNRATALEDQGRLDDALAGFRRALEIDPDYLNARDNLLLCLNYHDGLSDREIFDEHRAYGARYEPPVPSPRPRRTPEARKRLRIGYLSGDFRRHSVAFFIWPVLAHHDRSRFEVTCYSDVNAPDSVTQKLRPLPERWRDTARLSDDELARVIEADQIDVLVDLAGHTPHNRLRLLAGRVAPVQVTWLGYPNTTGLCSIDYRITDACADPPGTTEAFHSERLVRLPNAFFCYAPRPDGPEHATSLPAARNGGVTFAVFTNFTKVRPAALRSWARVLEAVPASRLVLQARSLADPPTRQAVADRFSAASIAPERIVLREVVDFPDYMRQYADVDVVLDTFPFVGHTTSCHALWMGVPVVTLAGQTHRQRMGASLLTNVGLPELVANDVDEYVRIAVALARDFDRLAGLRAGLRQRVQQSPVGDCVRFTRDLESAYFRMLETDGFAPSGTRANLPV